MYAKSAIILFVNLNIGICYDIGLCKLMLNVFFKRFLTSKTPPKPAALSFQNLFVIYLKFSYWTDLQLPIQSLSCWYYYFNKEV